LPFPFADAVANAAASAVVPPIATLVKAGSNATPPIAPPLPVCTAIPVNVMTTRVGTPAFEAPVPELEPDPVLEPELPEPDPVLELNPEPEPAPVPLVLDDRMANGSAETTVLAAKTADAPPIDDTTEADADAAAASEEDEDDAVDDDEEEDDAEAGEYGNTVDDDCIDGVSNVTLTALAHDCTLDLSDSDAAADTATN
jgi:hypothetical protein